jgi:hypothetical protein
VLRFILNFIVFGLIFYGIWLFAPEVFNNLVLLAEKVTVVVSEWWSGLDLK